MRRHLQLVLAVAATTIGNSVSRIRPHTSVPDCHTSKASRVGAIDTTHDFDTGFMVLCQRHRARWMTGLPDTIPEVGWRTLSRPALASSDSATQSMGFNPVCNRYFQDLRTIVVLPAAVCGTEVTSDGSHGLLLISRTSAPHVTRFALIDSPSAQTYRTTGSLGAGSEFGFVVSPPIRPAACRPGFQAQRVTAWSVNVGPSNGSVEGRIAGIPNRRCRATDTSYVAHLLAGSLGIGATLGRALDLIPGDTLRRLPLDSLPPWALAGLRSVGDGTSATVPTDACTIAARYRGELVGIRVVRCDDSAWQAIAFVHLYGRAQDKSGQLSVFSGWWTSLMEDIIVPRG
jgi:hypothetical protein